MTAAARSGSLQRRWDVHASTRVQVRPRVIRPALLVEIDGEEEARLVEQHGVHAGDERLTSVIVPRQVPAKHSLAHGQQLAIRALRTLDPRLLADAPHPFVRACWRVP